MRKYVEKQDNIKDCGIACLASIIRYYKGYINREKLIELTKTDRTGTTAYHMKKALIELGFSCKVLKLDNKSIDDCSINLPCIAHVIINEIYNHYIVIYKINKKKKTIVVMDPNKGYKTYTFKEFESIWSKHLIVFYPIKKIIKNPKKQSVIKFCKSIIKPHKKMLIGIIFLSFIFTAFSILNSFYFKYIIDSIEFLSINDFKKVSIVFLIIIILKIFTDFFRNRLLIYINNKIDKTVFKNTINHIISLPYSYYKNKTTGEVVSRISDLSYIRDMISRVSITLFVDLILASFALAFLYVLSNKLFLISISVLILYIFTIVVFNKKLQNSINENVESEALVASYMVESLNAFETIKGLHLEKSVKDKINCKYEDYILNNLKFNKLYIFQNILKDIIGIIGSFLILYFGTILVMNNEITLGTLITYNVLFLYFIEPIRNVIDLEPLIRQAHISVKRILELYEIESEKFIGDVSQIKGNIKIENLNFTYNDQEYIFENFNMSVNEKEKILLVGESGCGKSTLLKLLMGYYKPNINQLILDNKDINEYNLKSLRENISYVSQNEILYTDTIYNNLCVKECDDETEINKIAKICLVDEIVKNNPLGYNLLLEENGFNISGGERQRVILARALLKKSAILLLDESTSQVDLISERKILKNIFEEYKNKTILIVSHRQENKDLFDKVVTIKKEGE